MSDYLSGIEELPRFRLPMLGRGGTYRAFEVRDESMRPKVAKGTTIVARYVEDWAAIANGTPCIVVTANKGILFKRIVKQGSRFNLLADSPLEAADDVTQDEVLELWEAKSYISSTFPLTTPTLDNLKSLVLDLQQQIKVMQDERVHS